MLTFLFVTTRDFKTEIKIEENKTISELIKLYFEKINLPDLYGDPDIRFITNANLLPHGSKEPIKKYIEKNVEINYVVVDDLDDKINRKITNNYNLF